MIYGTCKAEQDVIRVVENRLKIVPVRIEPLDSSIWYYANKTPGSGFQAEYWDYNNEQRILATEPKSNSDALFIGNTWCMIERGTGNVAGGAEFQMLNRQVSSYNVNTGYTLNNYSGTIFHYGAAPFMGDPMPTTKGSVRAYTPENSFSNVFSTSMRIALNVDATGDYDFFCTMNFKGFKIYFR